MWAFLLPLLSSIPGLLGSFFKDKLALQTAQNQANLQIEIAKIGMAKEIATAQLNLNATIVGATSSWFKYFTFFMWFGPFMVGVIFPHFSTDIFTNLAGMPQWYVTSCITIMFTVWGISVSADCVNGIFSGLGDFFSARRDHKLAMAKVDRKAFYNALREAKGFITADDVKVNEKAFDAMDKVNEENG